MNKKYFTDSLSDETLAKIIDDTLNFKKSTKNKNIKSSLLKLIPMAAAVLLVIGLLNILPVMMNVGVDNNVPGSEVTININTAAETAANDEDNNITVTTQIGELTITTPIGQEPIQNDDGTITLPGGGTYEMDKGNGIEKVTISSGAIIRSDGTFSFNPGIGLNIDITAIIEEANGDVVVMNKDGMTVNGKTMEEIMAEDDNYDYNLSNTPSPSYNYDELIKEIYGEAVLVEKTFTNISNISLDLCIDNVVVKIGGDSIKVKYYEWTKDEYKLSENNGKLKLKYMETDKYYNDENGSYTNNWVDAVVKKARRQIDPENPKAERRTVEITIPENITLESLIIDGAIGDINIDDCGVKKINADTAIGNINLNNCKDGLNYTADTSVGDINVNSCDRLQNLKADTSNGNIVVNDCDNIQKLLTGTTNGDITISNCQNGQDYTADTVNGHIVISSCTNIENLTADTVNGYIFLSDSDIKSAMIFDEVFNNIKNDTFSPKHY